MTRRQPHALVVGESVIDLVTDRNGVTTAHPGGSAANTAVALARLGRSSRLASSFADDDHGALIRTHLSRSRVRLANDPRTVERTATARATIGADGSAAYDFDIDWHVTIRPSRQAPTVVHVTSLAPVLMPGAANVLGLVQRLRPSTAISYDINARPEITGRGRTITERVERAASLSDIIKASDEDLRTLYPGADLAAAARRLLALGPRAVVVTRGSYGASWFARRQRVEVPSWPTPVVDTIGAGDSFSAALIDGLWSLSHFASPRLATLASVDDSSVAALLAYASSAAAIAVSRAGANPPSRSELDQVPCDLSLARSSSADRGRDLSRNDASRVRSTLTGP